MKNQYLLFLSILFILNLFLFQLAFGKSDYLYSPFKQELMDRVTKLEKSNFITKLQLLRELKKEVWKNNIIEFQQDGDFDIDHDKKIIIGTISNRNTSTRSIYRDKLPVACDQVKAAYDSSIYFYERIKNIGDELLSSYDGHDSKKILSLENELQRVAKLLIQVYPPSFGEVDRILTYNWDFPSLEEAFKQNAIDIDKIDIDQIHIFNTLLDTRRNHNFVSLPFERPYFENGKILVEFNLTPTEACLQNLSLEMEGNLYLKNYSNTYFDWNDRIFITGGDLPTPAFIPPYEVVNPWEGIPNSSDDNWCGSGFKLPQLPQPGHFPFPGFGGGGGFPGIFGMASPATSFKRDVRTHDIQQWKLYLRAYVDMNAE